MSKDKPRKYVQTLANDDLQNVITSMNCGTDRLNQSKFVNSNYYSYEELASMYMSWLGRRIVDLVPDEALKKGWIIRCPSWTTEKINRLQKYCDVNLHLKEKISVCLKSQRLFGGSVMLAILNSDYGAFSNEAPTFIGKNTLLAIQPFDAWQCYAASMNFTNPLKKNFRNPETYTIGSAGLATAELGDARGTLVHYTRIERFDGLYLPWYDKQRNLYWGQSVLSSAYSAIRNATLVDNSIATLLFRASVPVFKVEGLADIVADKESASAFLERVNLMNYGMSNNNLAIIDDKETLESFEPGSISNLDEILERYYVSCSTATGIPVVKLIGESAKGLNATGEGDLNNYYDMLEDYQKSVVLPRLIDIYNRWIIPSFFDELMPSDFQIEFPALERMSQKEKVKSDREFVDLIISAKKNGLINEEVAKREIQDKGIFISLDNKDISYSEDDEMEIESESDEEEDVHETFKELNKDNPCSKELETLFLSDKKWTRQFKKESEELEEKNVDLFQFLQSLVNEIEREQKRETTKERGL